MTTLEGMWAQPLRRDVRQHEIANQTDVSSYRYIFGNFGTESIYPTFDGYPKLRSYNPITKVMAPEPIGEEKETFASYFESIIKAKEDRKDYAENFIKNLLDPTKGIRYFGSQEEEEKGASCQGDVDTILDIFRNGELPLRKRDEIQLKELINLQFNQSSKEKTDAFQKKLKDLKDFYEGQKKIFQKRQKEDFENKLFDFSLEDLKAILGSTISKEKNPNIHQTIKSHVDERIKILLTIPEPSAPPMEDFQLDASEDEAEIKVTVVLDEDEDISEQKQSVCEDKIKVTAVSDDDIPEKKVAAETSELDISSFQDIPKEACVGLATEDIGKNIAIFMAFINGLIETHGKEKIDIFLDKYKFIIPLMEGKIEITKTITTSIRKIIKTEEEIKALEKKKGLESLKLEYPYNIEQGLYEKVKNFYELKNEFNKYIELEKENAVYLLNKQFIESVGDKKFFDLENLRKLLKDDEFVKELNPRIIGSLEKIIELGGYKNYLKHIAPKAQEVSKSRESIEKILSKLNANEVKPKPLYSDKLVKDLSSQYIFQMDSGKVVVLDLSPLVWKTWYTLWIGKKRDINLFPLKVSMYVQLSSQDEKIRKEFLDVINRESPVFYAFKQEGENQSYLFKGFDGEKAEGKAGLSKKEDIAKECFPKVKRNMQDRSQDIGRVFKTIYPSFEALPKHIKQAYSKKIEMAQMLKNI